MVECRRCELAGCDETDSGHDNVWQMPPSICRDAPSYRYQCEWCECCLGKVWHLISIRSRELMKEIAAQPSSWVATSGTAKEKQKMTNECIDAANRADLGTVFDPKLSTCAQRPPLATASRKWGTPFAFNEVAGPMQYKFPLRAAIKVSGWPLNYPPSWGASL